MTVQTLHTAVVLFNLGGPTDQEAVRPFLFNLFHDKAIIQLPQPLRFAVALLISTLRAPKARLTYAKMGGGSPLVAQTQDQADALKAHLETLDPTRRWSVVPAMRYWRPFLEDVARQLEQHKPDDIVLLPLYPQFSTTTTGSSLRGWKRHYRGNARIHTVCCYPQQDQFIVAHAEAIRAAFVAAGSPEKVRLLFSAHGLPEKVIKDGDPYQMQIEATARAVAALLPELPDWSVCYQSRVGPLKWIGPSTEQALEQAAEDTYGVIISPIAFVSEHVETLVELDDEYAEKAEHLGIQTYIRVPALQTASLFIDSLAAMTQQALTRPQRFGPIGSGTCAGYKRCPCVARGLEQERA